MNRTWLAARWAAFVIGPLVALVVLGVGSFVGRN